MQRISASVGRGGRNLASDVKIVQQLLNGHTIPGFATPLEVDGLPGPRTLERIEAFQKGAVGMAHPDGRVDPEGKTLAMLNEGAPPPVAVNDHQLSGDGLTLLKAVEGVRLKPYDDQTGREITAWVRGATIGVGHLIGAGEWERYRGGISQAQADRLLVSDLAPFCEAVNRWVTLSLAPNQFDALVILTFNIGTGNFRSSSVLKLVNDPSAATGYPDLESAWKAWNRSQGRVMQGLINRRNAEWNIYSKGIYETW